MAIAGKYRNYHFSKENEDRITYLFNMTFEDNLCDKRNMIIDNTNLKPKYYEWMVKAAEKEGYEVEIKKFPIPLWKAQWRNIKRWITTGGDKYIPWKVMKDMARSYKNLK